MQGFFCSGRTFIFSVTPGNGILSFSFPFLFFARNKKGDLFCSVDRVASSTGGEMEISAEKRSSPIKERKNMLVFAVAFRFCCCLQEYLLVNAVHWYIGRMIRKLQVR